MPIWLRLFTFNKMKEHYDKQAEEQEKTQNLLKNKQNKEIARPNITPTYKIKAPTKK